MPSSSTETATSGTTQVTRASSACSGSSGENGRLSNIGRAVQGCVSSAWLCRTAPCPCPLAMCMSGGGPTLPSKRPPPRLTHVRYDSENPMPPGSRVVKQRTAPFYPRLRPPKLRLCPLQACVPRLFEGCCLWERDFHCGNPLVPRGAAQPSNGSSRSPACVYLERERCFTGAGTPPTAARPAGGLPRA